MDEEWARAMALLNKSEKAFQVSRSPSPSNRTSAKREGHSNVDRRRPPAPPRVAEQMQASSAQGTNG